MKLLFALLVALIGMAVVVKADEIQEPLSLEIGAPIEGQMLLDLYFAESEATADRSTHSVTIRWAYSDIHFIRVYAYAVS